MFSPVCQHCVHRHPNHQSVSVHIINIDHLFSIGGEFFISSTGEVTTRVNFDRESTDSYELEILVTDSGITPSALSTTTTLTIAITGNVQNM